MDDTATTYHTMDKSDWGDGPWQDEPDKVQWIDEATGLDCLIVRQGAGALCGYVGVPPDHPWHGVDYGYHDGDPNGQVEVHGGLTFADRCHESDDPSTGICHIPAEGRPADVWWFGFDCAHAFDLAPRYAQYSVLPDGTYRDMAYVKAEVASLARQIAAVSA